MKPQQIRSPLVRLCMNVPLKKPRNALKYCEFPMETRTQAPAGPAWRSRRVSISIAEEATMDQGDTLLRTTASPGDHGPTHLPLSDRGESEAGSSWDR